MAYLQSEEWNERIGFAAGFRARELPQRLADVAQTAKGHGSTTIGRGCKAFEVDKTYLGAAETGVTTGRQIVSKALLVIAAEVSGKGIGRIRMQKIPSFDRKSLHNFIQESIEEGSTVYTDGLNSYRELSGYKHKGSLINYNTLSINVFGMLLAM